jgi:antagonist of KipI
VSITVLRGGLQTTVQDIGGAGFGRYGVPERGALDPVSLRIANMLVGNDADAAGLEIALVGPELRIEASTTIAVCGAELSVTVNGRPAGIRRALRVDASDVVRLGTVTNGVRAYLAVRGGIDVPVVLGSRSTYVRARFGGVDGRALQSGDRILVRGSAAPLAEESWSVGLDLGTPLSSDSPIHVIAVASHAASSGALYRGRFTLSPAADRMGLRFVESVGEHTVTMTSAPAPIGSVQLPPDGRPIVLMNDHQTTGGYPIIGVVAAVDLPRLAQLRPGATIAFERIDVDAAHEMLRAREHDLRRLSQWIDLQRQRR